MGLNDLAIVECDATGLEAHLRENRIEAAQLGDLPDWRQGELVDALAVAYGQFWTKDGKHVAADSALRQAGKTRVCLGSYAGWNGFINAGR